MEIKDRVALITREKNEIANSIGKSGQDIILCAVTKTRSPEEINQAIDAGIEHIGENKVQELLDKYPLIKPGVKWHFIGQLQTNKVKYIIDKVSLIHSVGSLKLAKEINLRASKAGLVMDILVQVNIGMEDSKSGVEAENTESLIDEILESCENVRICGLMCIAPFLEDSQQVRPYFVKMKELYDKIKVKDHSRLDFRHLSMGMSHDYREAILEGASLIRVGTAMFGERHY